MKPALRPALSIDRRHADDIKEDWYLGEFSPVSPPGTDRVNELN